VYVNCEEHLRWRWRIPKEKRYELNHLKERTFGMLKKLQLMNQSRVGKSTSRGVGHCCRRFSGIKFKFSLKSFRPLANVFSFLFAAIVNYFISCFVLFWWRLESDITYTAENKLKCDSSCVVLRCRCHLTRLVNRIFWSYSPKHHQIISIVYYSNSFSYI